MKTYADPKHCIEVTQFDLTYQQTHLTKGTSKNPFSDQKTEIPAKIRAVTMTVSTLK